MFKNREDAAHQLSHALRHLRGQHPLLLAIPRGAVPMAKIIASELQGDLDVVMVRKLGAPGYPELAIGAVDEAGVIHVGRHAAALGVNSEYLDAEAERQLALLRERRQRYGAGRPPLDPRGRIAVVVDDGLATGATMHAALLAVRAKHPARLICALPVAAADSLRHQVDGIADEVVCLSRPEDFYAVGQFYLDFPQVTDGQVIAALNDHPAPNPA